MYEERKESFSVRSLILQILFVVLTVFLLLWLFPTKNYVKDYANDAFTEKLQPLYNQIYNQNITTMKEAAINYEIPHNLIEFDNTLESWAEQGILMINTALTCEVGRVGAHFDIWKPFVSKLIHNMSYKDGGMIYVLFGSQAGLFKNDIVNSLKTIEVYHPAYYARTGKKMPSSVFTDINQALKQQYNYQIEFYKETEYGTC